MSKPWEDPENEGYRTPYKGAKHCVGCGQSSNGCAWGPWCFTCNVQRMRRINKSMAEIEARFAKKEQPTDG